MYQSFSELDITADSSIESIHNALPVGSILKATISKSPADPYPYGYGWVTAIKITTTYTAFEYRDNIGSRFWYGGYLTPETSFGWTGWHTIVTTGGRPNFYERAEDRTVATLDADLEPITYNSYSLRIRSLPFIIRDSSIYFGAGGDKATGDYNTAFGRYAMEQLRNGVNNTAFGCAALRKSRSANHNTAVGLSALLNLIDGVENHVLGYYAMQALKDGSYNAGIGHRIMNNLEEGSHNVAVGTHAGSYYAGSTANVVTKASGNVYIGCLSYASNNNQANEIVIGKDAIGGGSNTVTLGNSAITKLRCQVTVITALSDRRTKEKIELANLDMCFESVKSLPVHRYKYKDFTGVHLDTNVTGFMADDVEKVFPKSVTTADRYFPVLDEDGKQMYEEIEETVTEIDENGQEYNAKRTRMVEKMFMLENVKEITMTEAVPTLWGAMQKLIEINENLQERIRRLEDMVLQ